MKRIKGDEKAKTKEYWCEVCGAACDPIDEEAYSDLRKAPTLCPGCKQSYDASCNIR